MYTRHPLQVFKNATVRNLIAQLIQRHDCAPCVRDKTTDITYTVSQKTVQSYFLSELCQI